MTVRLRLAAVAVALLVPALVLGRWLHRADWSPPNVATPAVPQQVGPWGTAAESRLEPDILAIADPDAHLMRLYRAPGRTPIWLYVGVYASRAGRSRWAHDPKECYPAAGWEILLSETLDVPLEDADTLRTRHMEVHRGGAKETVLYWFQPAYRWPATAAAEQLLRVVDAVRGHPQYAFVRLSGPTDGSPTAARDLAEVAEGLAAPIRAAVEQIDSAREQRGAGGSRPPSEASRSATAVGIW
jgi:EpsI family protein